jgi:hypothetical protein
MTTDSQHPADAVARRDCDSTHLAVIKGGALGVLDHLGDYILCRIAAGVAGWAPESYVEDTVEGP